VGIYSTQLTLRSCTVVQRVKIILIILKRLSDEKDIITYSIIISLVFNIYIYDADKIRVTYSFGYYANCNGLRVCLFTY
jgi:hypothetical protein